VVCEVRGYPLIRTISLGKVPGKKPELPMQKIVRLVRLAAILLSGLLEINNLTLKLPREPVSGLLGIKPFATNNGKAAD
jgi:hypothetical protein